jgi:hypothetical protein
LLVSKADAAEMLSISLDSFERIVMGEVRVVRVGRRVLFTVVDLERWVDEHAAVPLLTQLSDTSRSRREARCRKPKSALARTRRGDA